jgi:hypothetical protein
MLRICHKGNLLGDWQHVVHAVFYNKAPPLLYGLVHHSLIAASLDENLAPVKEDWNLLIIRLKVGNHYSNTVAGVYACFFVGFGVNSGERFPSLVHNCKAEYIVLVQRLARHPGNHTSQRVHLPGKAISCILYPFKVGKPLICRTQELPFLISPFRIAPLAIKHIYDLLKFLLDLPLHVKLFTKLV